MNNITPITPASTPASTHFAADFGYGHELHSEILPGLWQGGTHDEDVITAGYALRRITNHEFETVVTLYARANAASWNVKEIRYGFDDGDMSDFDVEADLAFAVREAHADWKAGKRVLIRCQAGLNRSGLVMALVLIRDGYSPTAAIEQIRAKRGPDALCNWVFENWLDSKANLSFWRMNEAA